MKNIFRRSVQIFHKKDKEEPGGGGGEPSKEHSKKDSSRGGDSPHGSKKDKKSKRNSRSYTDSDGISPNNSISSSSSKTTPTATSITTMFSPPTSPPLSSSEGIPIGYNNGASGDGRRVFGVALADVPCRGGSRVPIIVEKLVDHLERTSLSTEGLFRIPGRDVTILECVRLFDSGADVDVSSIEPYTAAGLLKRFFRDLPVFVPLSINRRVTSLFLSDDGKKKQVDMEVLEKMRQLVHQLPPCHFEVMQALTGLLSKLLAKSAENKMTVTNIAICLVPTLNCVPAIVTYPIQYHDFFFSEPFAEHHHAQMRPLSINSFLSSVEEKSELASEMQKRYSRPASITISGLLPTDRLASGAAVSSSPSSNGGTITSTTITSPNDASTPITFTVTTTYLDEQQSNSATGTPPPSIQVTQPGGSFNNNMLEQPSSANSTMVDRSYQSNRRAHKLEDIQYQQFIEEHQFLKNQFQQQGGAANNNSNNTASSSSFDNIGRSYRRSTMFVAPSSSSNTQQQQQQTPPSNGGIVVPPTAPTGVDEYASLQSSSGSFINNNITKANIQQLKEKIDRYSKEKMRELRESQSSIRTSTSNLVPQGYERVGNSSAASAGDPVPNKDKLYRYSIDVERFKDNRRNSRDIGREIEREINKRLSPRERISMLLANQQEYTTTNSPGGGAVGSAPVNGSNNRNYRYSNQPFGGSNKYVTRDSGSDRSNRNSNRFSRDSYKDYNYNDEEEMYNREEMYNIQRQRSQSCFEQQQDPINVVSGSSNGIGSGIGGIGSTLNNNINNVNTNRQSGSYQSVLLEQKMDKIRETINNIKIDRDRDNTRNSRDYTNHMRDIDELRQSLQKESETSEFFAIKSLELVEKLRKEEEKNLKLMEELSLMESYFHLKEKLKRSKRQSTTKQLLTRSRSPTLPTNMNHPSTSPSFFNIPSPTTTTTTSTSSTSTMNQ